MTAGKEGSQVGLKELEERVHLAELKAREAEADLRLLEAQAKKRSLKTSKAALDPEQKRRRDAKKAARRESRGASK